jgi:hypothetical protein
MENFLFSVKSEYDLWRIRISVTLSVPDPFARWR